MTQPTRYSSRGNGDVLDFYITAGLSPPSVCFTVPALASDHLPVIAYFGPAPARRPTRLLPCFRATDWAAFTGRIEERLPALRGFTITTTEELDLAASQFAEEIGDALRKTTPLRPRRGPWNPALPAHILSVIRQKNATRRKWIRTGDPLLKRAFRRMTRDLHSAISEWKEASWANHLSSLRVQDGSLWRAAKNLAARHPAAGAGPSARTPLGKLSAERFASYLAAIYSRTSAETPPAAYGDALQSDLPPPAISCEDVSAAISTLRLRKAPGPDGIPNEALKALPPSAIAWLQHLLTSVVALGHFPRCWKEANIVPIPKAGKPTSAEKDFRPISLLNGLGKVAERVLLPAFTAVIEERGLHLPEQFGFRSQHATAHQLLRVLQFATSRINAWNHIAAMFFDISKAFDRMWHDGFLLKLRQWKFPGWLQDILASYLKDRTFRVSYDGDLSPRHPISAGIPQGSVWGPTIFNLFCADIPTNLGTQTIAAFYADDAALFCASWKRWKAAEYLQEAVDRLLRWYGMWNLEVNPLKTQAIIFSLASPSSDPDPVIVDGMEVPWAPTATYLGVLLDRKLSFTGHAAQVSRRARGKRRALYPLLSSPSISLRLRILLYRAIILSALSYASPVWSGMLSAAGRALVSKAERSILRTICQHGWTMPNEALYAVCSLPTIEEHMKNAARRFYERLKTRDSAVLRALSEDQVFPWDRMKRPFSSLRTEETSLPKRRKTSAAPPPTQPTQDTTASL